VADPNCLVIVLLLFAGVAYPETAKSSERCAG
jgi:hypothetical protein